MARLHSAAGPIAAGLLGVVAFLLFVGWTVLIPTNIAWLASGDRSMHQLGWMFFRHSPWGLPPGISPDLGIELSNSIGLVDGLPLFALPFKLIQAWLPEPFQYWGYWLLLCFVLQGMFAFQIAREWGARVAVGLIAAAFVLIAPAFLFRYPMHLALGGHWVILAAIYLYVRAVPPRLFVWPLLCAITAAIHAYLLAIVLTLWAAAWLQRLLTRQLGAKSAAVEVALVAVSTFVVLWAAGFLMTASLGSKGFGDYKLNLLGFILKGRWSWIFPDIPHTPLDYEGMSFLGIGIIALALVALLAGGAPRLQGLLHKRWLPLAVAVLALSVFALSNRIAFADVELWTIPLPDKLLDVLSAFRSSGRFVWPLVYVITIGAVVFAARPFRPAIATSLVLVVFAVQFADSSAGLIRFQRSLPPNAATWLTPLISPFWDRAAGAGYNRVRAIPVQTGYGGDWQAIPYYAVTHGMDVDIVNLGRIDEPALEALRAKAEQALVSGDLEPRTLYELDAPSASRIAAHLAPDDLLATIDDRIIFARHGAHLVAGLGIEAQPPTGG